VKPNLIKRTVISFNSKGNFYHWGEEQKKMKDDGVYTDSQIKITWDYITNKFEICVGENSYEKDPHNTGYVRSTGPVKNADIELDFGDKYRYEIKSMKIRLGKLYKKVHRDLKAFNDQRVRKVFTDVATHVFPDILDPLILGSFSSEKRNDRGVSNEGRKDPSDTSSTP
jgi:actin-like ATPase involved in cell morphogenesis